MVRPTIRRKNLYRLYLRRAQALARVWSRRYPAIESVMLTGGVARGYADEASELDLTVCLTRSAYRSWVERCESPFPEGDQLVDGTWVDLRLWSIELEKTKPWQPLQLWDASFARVLFDRRGRLRALLRRKLAGARGFRSLHEDAIMTEWFIELGEEWINRTDPVAGHHLLNLAFDRWLRLLYGAQGEIPPFEKWGLHLSRTLPKLPVGYELKVREWLELRAFTPADIRRRARAAWALLSWWKRSFPEAWESSLTRDVLRALRSHAMSLEAFERRFGLRCLLAFPLRAVVSVRTEGRRRRVRVDEAKLRGALEEGVPEMLWYQQERLRLAVASLDRRR